MFLKELLWTSKVLRIVLPLAYLLWNEVRNRMKGGKLQLVNVILTIIYFVNRVFLGEQNQLLLERLIFGVTLARIYQIRRGELTVDQLIEALSCFSYLIIGEDYLLTFMIYLITLNWYIEQQEEIKMVDLAFISESSFFFWLVSGHRA